VKFLKEGMECNVLSWSDKVSGRMLAATCLASKNRPRPVGVSPRPDAPSDATPTW